MNHYELWFTTYHMGDNNVELLNDRELGYRLVEVWSSYNDKMVLDEMTSIDGEQIKEFYDARVLHHTNVQALPKGMYRRVNNPTEFDIEEEWDLYVIHIWNLKDFKAHFRQWLVQIVGLGDETGADDGTYDYYPDNWYVAHQIAHALRMGTAYTRARNDLLASTQYGNFTEDVDSYIPVY